MEAVRDMVVKGIGLGIRDIWIETGAWEMDEELRSERHFKLYIYVQRDLRPKLFFEKWWSGSLPWLMFQRLAIF